MSVTDNAGGHARLSPYAPGESIQALGHDAIVHVACRDRNRNAMQSLGWDLLSRNLTTVLAITGDYPVEGYEGLPRPVFDIDSVALLELLRALGDEAVAKATADGAADPAGRRFYLGCAIDPFKRLERDLIPQFLKLALKRRAGADYAITQVGYDAHRGDQLLRWMRREGDRPAGDRQRLHPLGRRRPRVQRRQGAGLRRDRRAARAGGEGRHAVPTRAARSSSSSRPSSWWSRAAWASGASTSPGTATAPRCARSSSSPTPMTPADWRSLVKDVSFGPARRVPAVRERRRRPFHRRAQPRPGRGR